MDGFCFVEKKMKSEHLVVTSAPNLACKHIMHVVAQEKGPEWRVIVKKCLEEADRNGYRSIAFPALGTGESSAKTEISLQHAVCSTVNSSILLVMPDSKRSLLSSVTLSTCLSVQSSVFLPFILKCVDLFKQTVHLKHNNVD